MIVVVYPQLSGVGGISRYIESWLTNISPDAEKVLVIHGGGAVRLKSRPGVELLHVPMPEGRLGLAIWTHRVRQVLKKLQRQSRPMAGDDLTAVQTRLAETERALALAREHLNAIEVKLEILEGAANVLDARTRVAPQHRPDKTGAAVS